MKKVICTDAECMNLTLKKEYEVLNEWKERGRIKPYEPYDVYLIIDDTGNESVEPSCLFKDVEDNTYNFSDLLNELVDTQFEVKYKSGNTDTSYIVIKKHNDDRGKYLQWDSGDEEFDDEVTIDEKIFNATFTKIEKSLISLSFDEAISKDDVLYRVEHEHMDNWLSYQALQKSKEYLEFNQLMELLSEIPADELKVVLMYGRWYIKEIGKSC
jgi:hypothetical protein